MMIIIFLVLCGWGLYYLEHYDAIYYTQVDNTKIEKISAKEYEYKLTSYNQSGNKKEFQFKTTRELRNSAYLELEVKAFGVHSWREVMYDELPEKVKKNYAK